MRPQRLKLRNIRKHRDTNIDFRQITCAAIVGENGAGKTTIAEGIQRALFSDGLSILPGNIITDYADSGAIELEYIHNGQLYRIIRTGGKRSDLQWLVSDGNGGWLPLSGATAKETQAKINASLGMDEKLFLSSCFMLQENTVSICKEPEPAKRKDLLYRIYDRELSRFAVLHDAAKKRVAETDTALSGGRAKRQDLEARIAAKAEHEQAKANAEESLQVIGLQLREAEAELAKLKEAAARQAADREKAELLGRQVSDLERECAEIRQRIDAHELSILDCQGVLAQADVIREQCARADELEAKIEKLAAVYEQYSRLGQTYLEKIGERDREVQRLSDESYKAVLELQRASDALVSERCRLNTEANGLRKQLEDAERQAALIDEVPCQGATAQACKLLAGAREAKTRIAGLESQITAIDTRLGRIGAQLETTGAEARKVSEEGQRAVEEARFNLQAGIDEIVKQKNALGYDKAAHTEAVAAFNGLKPAREKLAGLSAAESKMEVASAAKVESTTDLNGKLGRLAAAKDDHTAAARGLGDTDEVAVSIADRRVDSLKAEADAFFRSAVSHDTVLDQIAQAEADLTALDETLSAGEHRRTVWATLQEAWSRDGIPALIIDAAIPQIEDYANDLLAGLSDGRMSLKFITQRRTGSGSSAGLAETLDILVSDGGIERPYTDWSCGEHVRINISVNLAIGLLLAERSGATVATLVLDDVCGPLDAKGKEALLDCIAKLQSRFECILLISQEEELRDRLPQQIEVLKGASGSEVQVA
jgi:exonuclease SbcC